MADQILSRIQQSDSQNAANSKTNFTVISIHDASPDYVKDNSFINFISKSSLCQDAIINKFYKKYERNLFEDTLLNTVNLANETINNFENNIVFGDRRKFSFYTSLLEKSQKYFLGQETSFGYALNKLNIDTDNLGRFLVSDRNEESFRIFYKNCLGYNNNFDVLINEVADLQNVSDEEIYAITENASLLSLLQLLNVTLFKGNAKSLTHSTNQFKRVTSNDENNYLTFNKRSSELINTVIGDYFNSFIHLNAFSKLGNVNNNNFNIHKTLNSISKNPYTSELLKTNPSIEINTLTENIIHNRNNEFVSFDILNQNIPEKYQKFMEAILRVNSAITDLGIVSEDFNLRFRQNRNRSFIQNSNIEINNIVFGTANSNEHNNLSKFIQKTKKNISFARQSLTSLLYDKIFVNETLIKNIYNKSLVGEKIFSRLGITHRNTQVSLISREEESLSKDLLVYEGVDIFESNNFLTNNNGFNYFTRANMSEIDNVINVHEDEKVKVESIIDNYYLNEISNIDIYKDLINFSNLGVKDSLSRLYEFDDYDYGNLPVSLLEEVAFLSRFTGNKNYELLPLSRDQESFKNNIIELLYSSVNNSDGVANINEAISNNILNNIANIDNIISYKELASSVKEASTKSILGLTTAEILSIKRNAGVDLEELINSIENTSAYENDFRRYAKDLNSNERKSDNLVSPRYFLVCGIPFIDIYSTNRGFRAARDLRDQFFLDTVSKGFGIIYKPFIGFILDSDLGIPDVNSFYAIDKNKNILTQLTQENKGILSSYVDFLRKYLEKININIRTLRLIEENKRKDIISFIENSFESYCNLVILQLSQTFEYSTALSAVKIFSEGPVDVMCGIDPLDMSNKINNALSLSGNRTKRSSDGFFGSREDLLTNVNDTVLQTNVNTSNIQKLRNLPENGYSNFTRNRVFRDTEPNLNQPALTNLRLDERAYRSENTNRIQDVYGFHILANRKWLYPYKVEVTIPKYQLSINYYDKSNIQNYRDGWSRRTNQRSARPATIRNILNTLYFYDENKIRTFLQHFDSLDYTDEINKQEDSNFSLERSSTGPTKFTGGTFHKEIFTFESIAGLNDDINNQENNSSEYLQDLIDEAEQYLYAKNKDRLESNNELPLSDLFDLDTHVLYWSQYNANYPIIQKYNYFRNIYSGLVEIPYKSLYNKLNSRTFIDISEDENLDAIHNVIQKIYTGIFSEDLSISYLFDTYRYAFEHIKGYKAFLETEVLNEETGEVEINNETIEEGIQNITNLVSKHYDDPSSFTFNDYISKINSAQNALIKLYSNKRIKELERIRSNTGSPINSKRHFNDAKIFFNSYVNNSPDLKILCIGLRENAVNTINRIINIELVKFDSIANKYSQPLSFKYKFDYYTEESSGNESNLNSYKVLEYDKLEKIFKDLESDSNFNEFSFNQVVSYLAKKYLTVVSGFGIDESSLKLDLNQTSARKSETPRVITSEVLQINEQLQTLNDDYVEMAEVSENLLQNDGEFSNVRDNIDYNVENDAYTDLIDTNIKNKRDIYKRLIQFDYQNISGNSLGEIYMPKEFTKIIYIPLYDSSFRFEDRIPRLSNNYSLKVNIKFE